jgi:hypothetical protein
MGIEFQPPRQLHLRVPSPGFAAVHPAMFGQIVVMRPVLRFRIFDADLRKQLHGAEGCSAVGGY